MLVTGAHGFVGAQVVSQLKSAGWVVYSVVRNTQQDEMDIPLDFDDLRFSSCLDGMPHLDAIVHLAAKVDFSAQNIGSLLQTNVISTAILAEFARRRGVRFIFASSALVAGVKAVNISHDSLPNADTLYARSKWMAEELVIASGASGTILRIGGIFGLHGPSHLGLNRAISAVVSGVPPEIVGSGDSLRNYIYVKDVAEIIVDVLRRDVSGVHLVAGCETLSIDKMFNQLCERFLPGSVPYRRAGHEGGDQLIDPSPDLLRSRSFSSALDDMCLDAQR